MDMKRRGPGRPLGPEKVRKVFWLLRETNRALTAECARQNMGRSQVVELALRQCLKLEKEERYEN